MDNKSTHNHDTSKANALINELSPYLLQHAYNPVQWQSWSDSVFEQAHREDKPLFISIGYATCHWCHVMEHESFENTEIAAILNDHFISVKVDREERPDIDAACMEVCQTMTGHGGWPLSLFMSSDKQPFYVGTYFPPETRNNRIGFKDILLRIISAWKSDRNAIIEAGQSIVQALTEQHQTSHSTQISPDIFEKADSQFTDRYDSEFGGFGNAPKFPTPHHLIYLIRRAKRTGNSTLLDIAEHTLTAMASGGIYDHIGFGFHRYSTDRSWHIPHFEKMLYDQAMLLQAYSEGYMATKNELFANIANDIVLYLQDRLYSPEGAYYSAEDADSEGEEGTFYLFSESELQEILTEQEYSFAKECFQTSEDGNYHDEATGKKNGKNILSLFLTQSHKEKDPALFESLRIKLKQFREQRQSPLLDDKILTDWNGLCIASLAYAARVFNKPEWLNNAENAYGFLWNTLQDNGIILHRFRNGIASINGFCDDYAAMMLASFELYQSTGNIQYIEHCTSIANYCIENFIDDSGKILQSTHNELEFHSFAAAYDGALPSAPSIIAMSLSKLGILTGKNRFIESAYSIIQAYGKQIEHYPTGFSYMLCVLSFLTGKRAEIVIAGDSTSPLYKELLTTINSYYVPESIVAYNYHGSNVSLIAPALAVQTVQHGAAVFVCKHYTCTLPAMHSEQLIEILSSL